MNMSHKEWSMAGGFRRPEPNILNEIMIVSWVVHIVVLNLKSISSNVVVKGKIEKINGHIIW